MSAPRLAPHDTKRLHGQCLRIQSLYLEHRGAFFTLSEIVRAIGGASEAGVSMRLRELTYKPYFWVKVIRKRTKHLNEYNLRPPKNAPPQLELL